MNNIINNAINKMKELSQELNKDQEIDIMRSQLLKLTNNKVDIINENGDYKALQDVLNELINYADSLKRNKINTTVVFSKTRPNAIIPNKTAENAGADIYACFDEDFVIINPHTTKLIPTGIACALKQNFYFQVEERGSTGSKGIKKSAGVIDSGYRGEIFIAITNTNNRPIVITKETDTSNLEDDYIVYPYNKAIAQLILHELPVYEQTEITYEELLKIPSGRGTGNLGSSGK